MLRKLSLSYYINSEVSFEKAFSIINGLSSFLMYPLSFWDTGGIDNINKIIMEVEKCNFSSLVKSFISAGEYKKNNLNCLLLGDRESFYSKGRPIEKFSKFAKPFKQKATTVAGLLPERLDLPPETAPYIYDVNDINEGMELIPTNTSDIITALGQNNFLIYLGKILSIIEHVFKNISVKDSNLFEFINKYFLLKISQKRLEEIIIRFFPVPIEYTVLNRQIQELVSYDEMTSVLDEERTVINYSNLRQPSSLQLNDYNDDKWDDGEWDDDKEWVIFKNKNKVESKKHNLELFNFMFDYRDLVLTEIVKIIYDSSIEEAKDFLKKEIELIKNWDSQVIPTNFISSYADKINKINKETDQINFVVGNSVQPSLYFNYSNYTTNLEESLLLDLTEVDFSKFKIKESNLKKRHIEIILKVQERVATEINMCSFGDSIERDLLTVGTSFYKSDYIYYSFNDVVLGINRYIAFPPLIEIRYTPEIVIVDDEEIDEEDYKKSKNLFKGTITAAKEVLNPIETVKTFYSLEYLSMFGTNVYDINNIITLFFLKNSNYLQKKFSNLLSINVEVKDVFSPKERLIGDIIKSFSIYRNKVNNVFYPESESIATALFSFVNLIELAKNEDPILDKMIKKVEELFQSKLSKRYTIEDFFVSEEHSLTRNFIERSLKSAITLWNLIKISKNIFYIKTKEKTLTFFNYINESVLKRKSKDFSSLEELILFRETNLKKETLKSFEDYNSPVICVGILDKIYYLLLDMDIINFLKKIRSKEIEFIIDTPGNMLKEIYSEDHIKKSDIGIRNLFDYIYYDYGTELVKAAVGMDTFIDFMTYKLGLDNVSMLIYQDYKQTGDADFLFRVFDRFNKRNRKLLIDILNNISQYDSDFYNLFYQKYRRF